MSIVNEWRAASKLKSPASDGVFFTDRSRESYNEDDA